MVESIILYSIATYVVFKISMSVYSFFESYKQNIYDQLENIKNERVVLQNALNENQTYITRIKLDLINLIRWCDEMEDLVLRKRVDENFFLDINKIIDDIHHNRNQYKNVFEKTFKITPEEFMEGKLFEDGLFKNSMGLN